MSPAMALTTNVSGGGDHGGDDGFLEKQYHKGVKQLCEKGLTKLPNRYVFPSQERPNNSLQLQGDDHHGGHHNLKLPVIDLAELQGPNRARTLLTLAAACEEYGFFQLVNHGIPSDVVSGMTDVCRRFFELPYEERSKYMSADMRAPVRYGTSFNQSKDNVFCWRDFLKLMCQPSSDVLAHWPSSPMDFRKLAATYAKETRFLFVTLMEAILESLVLGASCREDKTAESSDDDDDDDDDEIIMKEIKNGSQLMILNCYPQCPEPDLTLGMPPHSDYGLLTLLLQDEVKGLQIQHNQQWVTVEPIPNSFVVNVGDHLEIFSNGRYKSVLHRVIVNSAKSRISVASLHSLPFTATVSPWVRIIDEGNPRRYKDTDFATFLEYASSREPKKKNFLESRKL